MYTAPLITRMRQPYDLVNWCEACRTATQRMDQAERQGTQWLARRREEDREWRARATAKETPEQREQRLAR